MTPIDEGISLDALARANTLFEEGDVASASALYRRLVGHPETAGGASYGLGVAALRGRDIPAALGYFRRSAELQPAHADSHFYLGYIAEVKGDPMAAAEEYRATLNRDPRHQAAAARLRKLQQGVQRKTPVPDPATPVGDLDSSGIYTILRNNPTPEKRQAEILARKLEIEVPARVSAHIGYYWPRLLVPLLITVVLELGGLHALQTLGYEADASLFRGLATKGATQTLIVICVVVQVIVIIAGLMVVVRASFTTLRCFQGGRFQIDKGVIFRGTLNIDLWRTRNIALRRTVINQLTGDAALQFVMPHELVPQGPIDRKRPKDTITVVGFLHGEQLLGNGGDQTGVYRELLTLSALLRAIPEVKGIIQ